MNVITTAVIVGGASGGLAVLLLGVFMRRRFCPNCKTALPRLRKPSSFRQAMLGGWTCPSCNASITLNGAVQRN
jgi:RNase P subunit RPR2